MPRTPRAIPPNQAADDKEQSKLFIEKAREIEADEEHHSAADELIRQLAKKPPEPRTKGKR